MIEFWMIKHSPTGGYLPSGMGRNGRGFTRQTVQPPGSPYPPRLFHTKHAAMAALRWWLMGETTVNHSADFYGEVDEVWHTEPCLDRVAEDMEIVKVQICPVLS